ncbi:glycoside hydrolase family 3 N-terminal domain-containing protein [Limibacter armeniacum]|uniref:glycoside hydrolase family 3 protein n=1 Tax=Limibacter armeniacum TaxID=466084 RepID=UPI002FE60DC6
MKQPPFLRYYNSEWVSSILSNMTLEEKIGQLFQVAAFSNRDKTHEDHILELIRNYHLGGVTFFQDNPEKQAELTNLYQDHSKVPMFINIDAEWGLAMRLKNTVQFPYQMALGAIKDDQLIYQMASKIGEHCKRLGIHSALAPVVDVNNNPENPVINYRSFGENKKKVAAKGIAYMKGLQDNQILDNAKHFPGHGDTAVDSHLALPELLHSNERLHSLELYPFKKMMAEGLSSVMTAHLSIPAWDDRVNMPATLSQKISDELLRKELGFEGLAITDALDMKGITNHYTAGIADKMAILAGNDIITNSESVPNGVAEIKAALERGEMSEELLDHKVRRILAMKQWVGLDKYKPIQLEGLLEDLNDQDSVELNKVLAEASLTLLKNEGGILPLAAEQKVACLHISNSGVTVSARDQLAHHLQDMEAKKVQNKFADYMQEYGNTDHFYWEAEEGKEALEAIAEKLEAYHTVVISIHGVNIKPFNYFDIPMEAIPVIEKLAEVQDVVFVLLGNAYALNVFQGIEKAKAIIVTYQESEYTQETAARLIAKGFETSGTLPVTINEHYREGAGL